MLKKVVRTARPFLYLQNEIGFMTEDQRPTFAQREGVSPIPDVLKPKELSQQLRAMLWAPILDDFKSEIGGEYVFGHWHEILHDYHVEVLAQMPESYSQREATHRYWMGQIFKSGTYVQVLDFTEFLLRHPKFPAKLRTGIVRALVVSRSAYRVVDKDTITAITGGEEAQAISAALAATADEEFVGVRAHLKNATQELRNGRFPESVRESIHAVEAVVQVLEPEAAGFAAALSRLETRLKLHGALKSGFASLYGFTSNAKGIRHSLGDVPEADVDEPLAIYMLGTCSAFVNFLISKTRK
jgi:hypothetical protein